MSASRRIIAVTGTRSDALAASIANLIRRTLVDELEAGPFTLHVGDARGVDTIAAEWAVEFGVDHVVWRAEWTGHGPAAGPIRNRKMLEAGVSKLIAFPGSRGTSDCIATANRLGIDVMELSLRVCPGPYDACTVDGNPVYVVESRGADFRGASRPDAPFLRTVTFEAITHINDHSVRHVVDNQFVIDGLE